MTYLMLSTGTVITYAIVVMALLLNVRPSQLSPLRRIFFFAGATAIILAQSALLFLLGYEAYGKFYLLFAQLPTLLLFCAISKRGFIKPLFVMLTTIFLASPGMTLSRILSGICGASPPQALLATLLMDVFMIYVIWRFMKPNFDYMLNTFRTRDILGFSATPLLYNFMILSTGGYTAGAQNLWFRGLISLSTLTAYLLLMSVFSRTREMSRLQYDLRMGLEAANQYLREQKNMQEQAVVYRHDMRHHLSLIAGFAAEGNLHKLQEYLAKTEADIDGITPVRYCENETVNLILSSFSNKAKSVGVDLLLNVALPEGQLAINDTELCSLLSNALENAISAAAGVETEELRKVDLRIAIKDGKLLISTENAYAGQVKMNGGLPQSQSQEPGHGLGIKSMASIVEGYGGLYSFQASDGVFLLRLVLPLEPLEQP